MPLLIRWLIQRDMKAVTRIEEACFAPYGWTKEDFLRCLRQRNCIGLVAEQGEKVIGYMVFELRTHSLKLLNLAVDPRYQRQGVGRQLLARLLTKLSPHRRTRIVAAVGEWNTGAHLWLRACGWQCRKVLRGYYEDRGDAYVFDYRIAEAVKA